ncbi:hypothetical protein PY093_07835 [Cytobacillus sp. S13-E01]|uniref:GNAT family N-acetyltransferase n=1 Tax=Cytobacillus sp. S13-E01 TaxID=3031326 RepID=UPI0023D8694E|nr:hypothetical protein [Cytobacillus sp. S13-E01]MDF0726623.1 hypothetical protein [Cytobacillus sp. S13-E01]
MLGQIKIANENDISRLKDFLGQANVNSDGVDPTVDNFILMEDLDQKLIATLGIERVNEDGLLRSLVISPKLEQPQILALFKGILSLAKQKELRNLYLATNKQASVEFFTMLGFDQIGKDELPDHLKVSQHLQHVLGDVDNSIFMRTSLR